MDLNEYYSSKWQIHVITTVEKLSKQLKSKNLISKSIKQIFNIGVIFNEDDKKKVYYYHPLPTNPLKQPLWLEEMLGRLQNK